MIVDRCVLFMLSRWTSWYDWLESKFAEDFKIDAAVHKKCYNRQVGEEGNLPGTE